MDLLAKRAFGEKGSYISSAMISFTQIGWFGVGVAMFAIPVANELLGGSKVAMWGLVIVAGGCMTASAYFGIDSLTLISYIAVPLVAVLGTVAMILAVQRGDGTIIDQFAKSSGTISVIGGAGMVVAAVCYVIGQMVRKNEAGRCMTCGFLIAMHSEEAVGGRFCRSLCSRLKFNCSLNSIDISSK